jgi:hypothetical protein
MTKTIKRKVKWSTGFNKENELAEEVNYGTE